MNRHVNKSSHIAPVPDRARGRAREFRFALAALLAVSVLAQGCWLRPARQGILLEGAGLQPLGRRVLFIAPHPDDECLAGAGFIQQAIARGVEVHVVLMTCGDASPGAAALFAGQRDPTSAEFRAAGRARAAEARDAMELLGLTAENITFLGYADGSLESLWESNWDYGNRRAGRNGYTRSPYAFAYEPGAPYCGLNVVRNLRGVIQAFKPVSVIYPSEHDAHHDHRAANAFIRYAVLMQGYRCNEYTYLVHHRNFPDPRSFDPSGRLAVPRELRGLGTVWGELRLSRRQEAVKLGALETYAVPAAVRQDFIKSFVRRSELFGRAEEVVPVRLGGAKPDFSAGEIPCVVAMDPRGDSNCKVQGSTDLVAVALGVGDSTSWLGLETAGPIRSEATYGFRLRVIGKGNAERFDIAVKNGDVRCELPASNSRRPAVEPAAAVEGRRIWIGLPSSIFSGRDACMLSVDTACGARRADRTAYRIIDLR